MTQRVVNYTYGTGNPVLPDGSIDVRDGIDNLQSMDVFMNAPEDTYNQRDGNVVRTVAGMNNEFDAQILNMGFTRIGTFAAGATLTNPRQTLLWDIADGGDGQEYGWSGSFPKVVPAVSTPASTGGISAGAWISRFDPELRIQVREALRRSYAEAGYNLVDGSFEAGGTLVTHNDVLLHEPSGKAFSGPAGTVVAGTDPTSGGFVDRSPISPGAGVIRDGRFALRDAVSLADYDDVFDGVKDNTLAMQKAVNTGRPVMLPNGTIRITGNIDFSSVAGVDIFAPFIGTTLLVDLPNGAYLLSNKDYATRGESKVNIQGIQIRQVNPLSKLFYVEKTYSPVLFEDLILLDSINCFDFVDLYGNPTVRRIKVRNSDSLGGAGDFLFRATGCNTFVLDNFTGNAGAFDGVLFLNNAAGSANYNNSLNNITIQGAASSSRRAIYYQGGDCVINNVYEEGRSSTQSIFLDGVKSAKLGAIHMTGGSVHAKDSNVFLSSVSFLKVNAAKADISAITSDNSNIVIGVINNNQDYDYRFERESSGSIKVLNDKNLRGRPIATKRLTQQNPINADATVTTDTTLSPLGVDFRYRVVTNGNSDTGIRLVVDGSGNLPAGTRITAVARIQTTDNSLVRFEKNSGDVTARYYFPTATRCDKTGDHVCILHLVATGNSFNGNVNVKTTSATTFYVYGEVYPGWVYVD